jgi:hypothetical protein
MTWRVHLTDNSIHRLDIFPGQPNMLCAWVSGTYAVFYDLETGAETGRIEIEPPATGLADRTTDQWKLFLDQLCSPNGSILPVVRLNRLTIHSTQDGRQRLYDDGHGLSIQVNGSESPLQTPDSNLTSVGMDRVTGITAALDEDNQLYIYQRQIPVWVVDIGLHPEANVLPELVVSDRAAAIFASDGMQLVRVNGGGRLEKARPMTYFINELATSPDGRLCATADSEAGIVRIYEGEDLAFTHQKFAVDLYAAAEPIQLMEDTVTPRIAVSAMAITNEGVLAFAMEGIITVTHLDIMQQMPRPHSLP